MPVSQIEWSGLTHAMAFAALITSSGTLDTTFYKGSAAQGAAWADELVTAGHAAGKKVFLTLGGENARANYASALSNATTRSQLIDSILAYITAHNFDGFDIDDEPITDTDVPDLLLFIDEIKAKRPSMPIAMCFGPANTNYRGSYLSDANLKALSDRVSMMNIMTYGMAGTWSGWSSAHSSPLYGHISSAPIDIDSTVTAFLAASVPSKKLGVGSGFYGIGYSGCTGPYAPSGTWTFLGTDSTFKYNVILSSYLPNMTRTWDSTALVPYLSSSSPQGPAGATYISYEDAQSITEKSKFIKSRNLGGLIMWHVAHQYAPGAAVGLKHPLLNTIRTSLLQ